MKAAISRSIRVAGLLLAITLAGCSQKPVEAAPTTSNAVAAIHAVSGLPVVPLTVRGGGKVHAFRVEVARSRPQQARGLMFRTAMGADEGMVFPMDPPREASFWMKNTLIPLDILFIGMDGRVLNIAANAVPYSLEPLSSEGPVSAVLELNAGRAAQLGISPGDKVEW